MSLFQTAAGRYEGDFPLDQYGAFQLRALHRREGKVVSESTGTVSVPYPREYLALPPDEALLARAATLGGGSLRRAAPSLFDPGTEKVVWHRDLWSLALYLATALIVLDIALRRIRLFGYRRLAL